MKKIRSSIEGKQQWYFLRDRLDQIERFCEHDQNDAIGHSKDLVETIAKTIVTDSGDECDKDDVGPLVKQAVRTMSFYGRLESKDQNLALKLASAFVTTFSSVGEIRNNHGTVGHGRDSEHAPIDHYLFDMAIECADSLGAFLIKAHDCDLHHRYRLRYEDNPDFNDYIDEVSEDYVIGETPIRASRALFSDIEAYKEQLQSFKDSPDALTETLLVTDNTEQTVARIKQISNLFNSSQIESLARLAEQQAELQKQLEPLLKSIDFSHLTKAVENMQPAIDAAIAAKEKQEYVIKRLGL